MARTIDLNLKNVNSNSKSYSDTYRNTLTSKQFIL